MSDLLIELFSEEIPARMQRRAAEDLKRRVTDGLVEAGLTYAGAIAHCTPRRLTLALHGLTERSADTVEERRGPRVGAPEQAIEGFLRGAGIAREALETVEEKRGSFHVARLRRPGRDAPEIVAEVLEATIRAFPWPKSMTWGDGTLRWVRPLRRILCLLTRDDGAVVVPLDVDGIRAADVTEGHRFMAPDPFRVTSFEDYEAKLKRAKVILSSDERAESIRNDMANLAFAAGLEVVEDEALLEEVAGLVEWPVVLMGKIGETFLDLPPEVLRTSMKEHQKFFSLRDRTGRIVRFVTVANRETADDGMTILAGNARVLAARLSDAKFFWENDLRVATAGGDDWAKPWLDALGNVTFHAKLGSQRNRIDRVANLAREIAPSVGADPDRAERAARLAKADLSSEMVYEFPELQGLMGRYYAEAAREHAEVAIAVQEHYSPLGPTDAVPTAPVSMAVALADKLDTLAGFWAIEERPTGSKDPYALRRAALGVIKLLLTNSMRISFADYIIKSYLSHFVEELQNLDKRKYPVLQTYSPEDGESRPEQGWDEGRLKGLFNFDGLISAGATEIENGLAGYAGMDYTNEKQIEHYNKSVTVFDKLANRIMNAQDFASFVPFLIHDADKAGNGTYLTRIVEEPYRSDVWGDPIKAFSSDLLAFLHDRLKVHLRDEGIRHDVIDACLTGDRTDDLADLTARARALDAFLATDSGENLIQGYRRARNILTQAETADGVEYSYGADRALVETDEERALFDAIAAARPDIDAALAAEDYPAALTALAGLRAPVDAFFEAVQVNAEVQAVRRNRLNLLSEIVRTCAKIADLSRIGA